MFLASCSPVNEWSQPMKTVIAALALITMLSAPSFAQHSPSHHNESQASPSFGGNGY